MRLHWTDVAMGIAFGAVSCAAIFAGLRRALRCTVAERDSAAVRQINALAATVKMLEGRVAELSREVGRKQEFHIASHVAGTRTGEAGKQLNPELVAVMTAAATAFLGRRSRIRQARLIPAAQDVLSPWSQQGRFMVQTSHNFRTRE